MEADDPILEALRTILEEDGRPLVLRDVASDQEVDISAASAVAPDALLPVLLAAGEEVWEAATGRGFGLRLAEDPNALLGFRVDGYDYSERLLVLLATLQAVDDMPKTDKILLNNLNVVWQNHHRLTLGEAASPGPNP